MAGSVGGVVDDLSGHPLVSVEDQSHHHLYKHGHKEVLVYLSAFVAQRAKVKNISSTIVAFNFKKVSLKFI